MVIIRDYKQPDLENSTRLMKIISDLLNIKFDEEHWKQQAKVREYNPQFRTLIAEEDGKVVGLCFADIDRDETGRIVGSIRNVVVDPQVRGKGIASELIRKSLDIFRKLKVHIIRVQVLEQVKDVMQLFEKLNFHLSHLVLETNVFKIREYKESDYLATKELMQIYSKLINIPFNEKEWQNTLKIRMRNPQYRILISEQDNEITGMALITIKPDETGLVIGYLENVIVHPKYRRLQVGKSLLIRAIETLNVLNVDKIRVMAHLEVKKWLKYFEDVGLQTTAYIMEMKLPETS